MQLFLYGGGSYGENQTINLLALKATGLKRPRVAFIPASSDGGVEDFADFVKAFDRLGVRDYIYFPCDLPFSETLCEKALSADLVFLGGGNTFHFLKSLRESALLPRLAEAASRGVVLAGLSAGAIVLTPSIYTASYPSFDCDENFVGLKNLRSLALLPFEFFPHFSKSDRYIEALLKHSKKSKLPLLASPNGSGIYMENSEIFVSGDCFRFHRGRLNRTVSPRKMTQI